MKKKTDAVYTNYLLKLSYDGSGFSGWQAQKGEFRTVQGELERVARAVFKQRVKMEGSGRTDAGVHALGQLASFRLKSGVKGIIPAEKVRHALNHSLPDDLKILSAEVVPEDFHARYNATQKVYLYRIRNAEDVDVFSSRYCLNVPGELDIIKMREAAEQFVGHHDFRNYSASNHGKKTTTRTIHAISVSEQGFNSQASRSAERFIEIRVRGDGFLWKMVRMIVHTIIEAGQGRLQAEQIPLLMEDDSRIKTAVAACGLFLEEVILQNSYLKS